MTSNTEVTNVQSPLPDDDPSSSSSSLSYNFSDETTIGTVCTYRSKHIEFSTSSNTFKTTDGCREIPKESRLSVSQWTYFEYINNVNILRGLLKLHAGFTMHKRQYLIDVYVPSLDITFGNSYISHQYSFRSTKNILILHTEYFSVYSLDSLLDQVRTPLQVSCSHYLVHVLTGSCRT